MTGSGIAIGLLWAAAAAALTWALARSFSHITYVTLADGQRQERRLPLVYRMVLPFAPNLARLSTHPALATWRADLDRRLLSAGFEGLLTGRDMIALRLLLPLGFGPIAVLLLHLIVAHLPGRIGALLQARDVLLYVFVLGMLFLHPVLWLRSERTRRHNHISRALPFVLDLLTLSVEAGMDFMTALKRIIEHRRVDALGEELIRVFREMQLGKTRRDALRDMAVRVDQADLRSVTAALVQADELGVSISAILRIQSDQMRTRRFLRAEKKANEAPVRMLLPLVGFIFPAVFIVLLGPVLLQFMQQGF